MDPALVVLGIIGILVGLAGIVLPVVPGSLIVWLATAGTFLLHRADAVGWTFAILVGLLALLGSAATVVLPARSGLAGGAARSSFALGGLGALVGFFVLPIAGAVAGFLLGLLVGERQRLGDWEPALSVTGRVVRSYGLGVLVDLCVAIVIAVVWVVAVLLWA